MTAEEVYRKKYGLPKRPEPQTMQQTPALKQLEALLQNAKKEEAKNAE